MRRRLALVVAVVLGAAMLATGPTAAATSSDVAQTSAQWRGWVAIQLSDIRAHSRYVSRGWYVDTQPRGSAVQWWADTYDEHADPPSDPGCRRSETAGHWSGTATSSVIVGNALATNPWHHGMALGQPGLGWNIADQTVTNRLGGGKAWPCTGGPATPAPPAGGITDLGWVDAATPLADTGDYAVDPPSNVSRSYQMQRGTATVQVVACLTRWDNDNDGDGLPNPVDLDSGRAGTLGNLGAADRSGFDHRVHNALGGPDGVSGLPACPVGVSKRTNRQCAGITMNEVLGPRPAYIRAPELDHYRNAGATCAGYWLPYADRGFVPQGLAVSGGSAYVSGYGGGGAGRIKGCRVMRIDLATGAPAALSPPIRSRSGVKCRHGGGLALAKGGLYVSDYSHLFLVDRNRLDTRHPVRRVWPIQSTAPSRKEKRSHATIVGWGIRGSYLVDAGGGLLGLGRYNPTGPGRYAEVSTASLLARHRGVIRVAHARRTPGRVQGAAVSPWDHHLYLAASSGYCGKLHNPEGRSVGFVPGAEGIAFGARGRIWALSESMAERYQVSRFLGASVPRPVVPMLVELKHRRLKRSDNCNW